MDGTELFGRPKYSEASDVYAYGVVSWELASRAIPYQEVINYEEVRALVKEGDREAIPSECPQSFAALIEACWAQSSSQRPSMDGVVTALEQIITTETSVSLAVNTPLATAIDYQDASLSTLGAVTPVPLKSKFVTPPSRVDSIIKTQVQTTLRPTTPPILEAVPEEASSAPETKAQKKRQAKKARKKAEAEAKLKAGGDTNQAVTLLEVPQKPVVFSDPVDQQVLLLAAA